MQPFQVIKGGCGRVGWSGGWLGELRPGRLEMRGGLSGPHELFRLVRPKWIWRPTRLARSQRLFRPRKIVS